MIFIILGIVLALLIAHMVFFFIWLTGHLVLNNFFKTKKGAFVFLIPIVGFFGLLFGAVRARIDEDY